MLIILSTTGLGSARTPELLRSVSALPPHLVGLFSEPAGFHQLRSGAYLVFDRRGHTVYGVDAGLTTATKIVQVGQESGHIIQPVAFAVSSDDRFVVAERRSAASACSGSAPRARDWAASSCPDTSKRACNTAVWC